MNIPRTRRGFATAALSALAAPVWSQGQALHLLTGFPSGIVDQTARLLAEAIGPALQ